MTSLLNPIQLRALREPARTGSFVETGRNLRHPLSMISQRVAGEPRPWERA